MPWLLYVHIFFSDFWRFDMSLIIDCFPGGGYLISIAYCLFFHLHLSYNVAHIMCDNIQFKLHDVQRCHIIYILNTL